MEQTRWGSVKETFISTLIGYIIAIASQILIFPFFDIYVPITDTFLIGMCFTGISLIRGYLVRRWFNNTTRKKMNDEVSVDITKEDLEVLLEDSIFLTSLMGAGVDSWSGFEEAQELYEASLEELMDKEKIHLGVICLD